MCRSLSTGWSRREPDAAALPCKLCRLGGLYMAWLTGAHAIRASHGSEPLLQKSVGTFHMSTHRVPVVKMGALCYKCQDKERNEHTHSRGGRHVCRERNVSL